MALGWLLIGGMILGMAIGPGLSQSSLIVLSLILAILTFKDQIEGFKSFRKQCGLAFQNFDKWDKAILLVVIGLILIRLIQASTPSVNWDSLNQHLPQLYERLTRGDLSPLYELPTDRRMPMLGGF